MDEMSGAGQPDARLLERFGRKFSAGEVLFREGELGHEAFLLHEGKVRLLKKVRSVERSLMVLRPGDFFGESALVDGSTRSATAVALTDGIALALAEGTLRALLQSNAAIASRVLQQLVRRLREMEDQIEFMMIQDTQSKVVAALIKIASNKSERSLAISPMELSSRVGLEADVVKRVIKSLREGEYVRVVNEKLEIPDIEALRKLYSLLGLRDELHRDAP